jgi:hypothetical protein
MLARRCRIVGRFRLRFFEECPEVDFKVARVGAQRLFRGGPAEAAGLELAQELLVQVLGEPL